MIAEALRRPALFERCGLGPATVLAVGKAAGAMMERLLDLRHGLPDVQRALVISPNPAPPRGGFRPTPSPLVPGAPCGLTAAHDGLDRRVETVEWLQSAHPVPSEASVDAGARALELAADVPPDGCLILLLSGGASALMAAPVAGVSLEDKRETTRRLLGQGADIRALNTVRKHLSRIKGGQMGAACLGVTLTLALSDVMDDDLSVIGSGPTVADPTTFADALAVLDRFGPRTMFPARAVAALEEGAAGARQETPKPGDPRLARAHTIVIGNRLAVVDAARAEAVRRGYRVVVRPEPVVGEARDAAAECAREVRALLQHGGQASRCYLSAGESTVTVRGTGKGGRNQEFALALAVALSDVARAFGAASVGTDGIDGPTDAAGAIVDQTTLCRAVAAGLPSPAAVLENNDTYTFFSALGDLVVTGPTDTNVGDVQIVLIDSTPLQEPAPGTQP